MLVCSSEFLEWLPKVSDVYTKKMPLDLVIQKYLLDFNFISKSGETEVRIQRLTRKWADQKWR